MNNIKNNILDVSSNHYEYLLNLKNVNGIGYGSKYVNNIDTKEPCIHVLVEEKISTDYISKNNIIPKTYMGIKTDVIKIGKLRDNGKEFFNPILGKVRPLEGGYDVSALKDIGTLGCIVTNIVNNIREYYILSNNHVLANRNKLPIGSPIYQPSLYYSGYSHKEQVAILSNFVPIKYRKIKFFLKTNYMDCAIARIINKNYISNKITKISQINGFGIPSKDLAIKKVGAVSGLTEGKIETLGVTFVSENSDTGFALFKNQIRASAVNLPGDSGSAVLNKNNEVIGLFFSGSEDNLTMMFSDINSILKELNVDIYINQ